MGREEPESRGSDCSKGEGIGRKEVGFGGKQDQPHRLGRRERVTGDEVGGLKSVRLLGAARRVPELLTGWW